MTAILLGWFDIAMLCFGRLVGCAGLLLVFLLAVDEIVGRLTLMCNVYPLVFRAMREKSEREGNR